MRIPVATRLTAVAAAVVTVGSATVTSAMAQPAGSVAPAPTVTRFSLVTGEQVVQRTDSAGRVSFSVAGSGATRLLTYRLRSSAYTVPAPAVPFLGSRLDPALFGTAGHGATQTPVRVSWRGAARPSMPWLTAARDVAAGTTSGTVTTSSGALLERDLAAQPRSASAWAGALQGIDRIALDAVLPPPPPTPQFIMHTLTVRGIDAAGAPDNGDSAVVLNVDNAAAFSAGASWFNGVLKLSVPDGHYSAIGTFFSGSPAGAGAFRLSIIDFTVRGDTTITIDARSATARVSVNTPRAAPSAFGTVLWQRDAATGGGVTVGASWQVAPGLAPFAVYVSPTPAPRIGTQALIVSFHLDSPASSTSHYTYDLAFESMGAITARQHYAVATGQLATVDARYYSDVAGRPTGEGRISFFPGQFFGFGTFDQFAAPRHQVEYVSAQATLSWTQQVIEDLASFAGFFLDSGYVFQPRQVTTANWGRAPIGPGVPVDTGAATTFPQGCPACADATGGALDFAIYPFGDNPPGRFGLPNVGAPGVTEADSFDLLRNGTSIASGQDPLGIAVPVTAGAATYQLGYSVAMSAPWWTLSTSTSTRWTFSTLASTEGTLPPGWVCFTGSASGCSVLDLMFPDYQLPVSLLNREAAGPTGFHLGVEHVLGIPVSATHAMVSVSFDGGVTWTAAAVTPSRSGGFTVSYANQLGHDASLRIHVVDANGAMLDQTIVNAYAVS